MTTTPELLALAGLRVACAAAFICCALVGYTTALLPLALVVEASDLTDGPLARWRGDASAVGNVYDSMADHFCRVTQFLGLYSLGAINAVPLVAFFWRDSLVVSIRMLALTAGYAYPQTRWSGKAKGICQGACLLWLSARLSLTGDTPTDAFSLAIVWTTVAVTTVSAIDYALTNRHVVARTIARR